MKVCKTDSRVSKSWGGVACKRAPVILIVVALVLLWSNLAAAQHTTGALRGQVFDPAGATVAGANVNVRNDATGVSQTTVTSSAGTYDFPSVLPGSYTLTVEAKSQGRGCLARAPPEGRV
jgi:protocatechuate 3,4-dioxygenase beta subunit